MDKWVEDWDQYFISQCYMIAMKSKDTRAKMAAIIIGPDYETRSTGYNNFPRGLNDDVAERFEQPLKYKFFEHAERNAIYNACRHGVQLKGCKLYCMRFPCTDCARGIINSGINEVIIHKEYPYDKVSPNWKDDRKISTIMFSECGVKVREWSGKILEPRILISGKEYKISDINNR